ncbi:hypothetical protein CRU87_09060 [Aliarcobacter trophiarum LMG 25534]|uniref:SH3 domain-containing protein n=1 Tax=Aliarcobacter trophiarum LMG 25534 TaxID=1032241 RepID=A0AAD0VM22_9BACT|nr:SH3 domain-containing protein [Aliarcobacter trophiarum]AXK48435.1 SH3 domain-containing protein [Aliarcobacter trophiarum LMG 25534]RXI26088.1 hypothetical protein CRU89_07120 [Aliarcobacter trophiarum]RXJ89590.1 hypothetical protein CRU87_09060 [Aliarcobacter trophiarum LMG 25534]
MKKIILYLFFTSLIFTGCAKNSNIVSNILSNEPTLKVGVKKALITEKPDAKSQIVAEVKINEELKIIKSKDDSQWYKVLTPNKQGYIPKSSLVEESFLDLFSDSASTLWEVVKDKNSNQKTTFDSNGKNWSNEERAEKSVKNFGNSKSQLDFNSKYTIEEIESLLTSSNNNSNIQLSNFRKEGGLK